MERAGTRSKAELAEDGIIDHTGCEECLEDYLFLMRDEHREFSMGLRTVLACLAFAEKENAVPPLPPEWWFEIQSRY